MIIETVVMAEETIAINKEDQIYTDDDLRYKISVLKPKKSKLSSSLHQREGKSFIENFGID